MTTIGHESGIDWLLMVVQAHPSSVPPFGGLSPLGPEVELFVSLFVLLFALLALFTLLLPTGPDSKVVGSVLGPSSIRLGWIGVAFGGNVTSSMRWPVRFSVRNNVTTF